MRGYRYVELCSVYGGIQQRWVVVESKARKEADLKQLQKRLGKAFIKQTAVLDTLGKLTFECHADALAAAQDFGKRLNITPLTILKFTKNHITQRLDDRARERLSLTTPIQLKPP